MLLINFFNDETVSVVSELYRRLQAMFLVADGYGGYKPLWADRDDIEKCLHLVMYTGVRLANINNLTPDYGVEPSAFYSLQDALVDMLGEGLTEEDASATACLLYDASKELAKHVRKSTIDLGLYEEIKIDAVNWFIPVQYYSLTDVFLDLGARTISIEVAYDLQLANSEGVLFGSLRCVEDFASAFKNGVFSINEGCECEF